MERIKKEQMIDALKQACQMMPLFPYDREKQLEEIAQARTALITALDNGLYFSAVKLLNCGVAALVLQKDETNKDNADGPLFSLANYAYWRIVNDIVEQGVKANHGKPLPYSTFSNLINYTIEIVAAHIVK